MRGRGFSRKHRYTLAVNTSSNGSGTDLLDGLQKAIISSTHSFIFHLSYFSSQVLEVVAASRGEDAQSLAEVIYDNTLNLFFS